jgi:hypothetical protein
MVLPENVFGKGFGGAKAFLAITEDFSTIFLT